MRTHWIQCTLYLHPRDWEFSIISKPKTRVIYTYQIRILIKILFFSIAIIELYK